MTVSVDLRWRCIVLYLYVGYDREEVGSLMGVHPVTIERWLTLFNKTGNVLPNYRRNVGGRYTQEIYIFIKEYIDEHPTFLFEGILML